MRKELPIKEALSRKELSVGPPLTVEFPPPVTGRGVEVGGRTISGWVAVAAKGVAAPACGVDVSRGGTIVGIDVASS